MEKSAPACRLQATTATHPPPAAAAACCAQPERQPASYSRCARAPCPVVPCAAAPCSVLICTQRPALESLKLGMMALWALPASSLPCKPYSELSEFPAYGRPLLQLMKHTYFARRMLAATFVLQPSMSSDRRLLKSTSGNCRRRRCVLPLSQICYRRHFDFIRIEMVAATTLFHRCNHL